MGRQGRMNTDHGWELLIRGNRSNLSSHNTPPRGGPLAKRFRGWGTNSPIGGNPWQNVGYTFDPCIISNIVFVPQSKYFYICQIIPRQYGRCQSTWYPSEYKKASTQAKKPSKWNW